MFAAVTRRTAVLCALFWLAGLTLSVGWVVVASSLPLPASQSSDVITQDDRDWYAAHVPRLAPPRVDVELSEKVLRYSSPGRSIDYVRGVRRHSGILVDATRHRFGWPLRMAEHSCWSVVRGINSRQPTQILDGMLLPDPDRTLSDFPVNKILPMRWQFWPMLINSIAVTLLLPWLWILPRTARRWLRTRAGRCAACGHELAGSQRCPECGRSSVSRRCAHVHAADEQGSP